MALSDVELQRVKNEVGGLCDRRTPAGTREQLSLHYSVNGHAIVLFERRPHYKPNHDVIETPVAKLKFVRTQSEWRLFWMRADLKWHRYDPVPASRDLRTLVEAVDEDRYACFFG